MWKGPGQDPGGGPDSGPPDGSSQELCDLKDEMEQQKVLIAQLKEMIRKNEQTNVTQEKVDEYMNTLSKRSGRAKKLKKDEDNTSRKVSDIPATQKINLLRQQVEENKARLAERGKSKKGIEDIVTQLKAQFDDSQHLISQTPINLSLQETRIEYNEHSSSQELYSVLTTKEKRISDLLLKVQKLESTVIDLQENLKEKDSVIDARTKAITLMTENLSKKGKTTLDTLDETREQMRKMQESFVAMESEMKNRQSKLLEDLRLKNYEIAELQEVNSRLDREKLELLAENSELKQKLESIPETQSDCEMQVLKDKIQELEELNSKLLEQSPKEPSQRKGKSQKPKKSKLESSQEEPEINYEEKLNEMQTLLESLKAENDQLTASVAEKEVTIKDFQANIEELKRKETEIGVDSDELAKLKKQLDESNKNMIKVKAQHKSKLKELTKQVEAFKKISDANAEIVKLETENCRLNQKIVELEEEKGTLQLKLVESETTKEQEKEFEEKIQQQQTEMEEKDKIITILETDILSLKNEIQILTEKLNGLSHLQNVQVTSEITSIQFEEQVDTLENEKKQLIIQNENVEKEKQQLLDKIEALTKEKQEISAKLDQYIQENMELVDKLEKLSAEKVSSAESIEIVEGLTQQEKLELEAYQKNIDLATGNLKASEENIPQAVDLNESVNELNEETSELLQRIELFTEERREVMEKLDRLKEENNDLNTKIKEIENNRDVLVETYEQLQTEKEALDARLGKIEEENEALRSAASEQKQHTQNDYQNLLKENEDMKNELLKVRDLENARDTYEQLQSEKEALDAKLKIIEEENENLKRITASTDKIDEYDNLVQENETLRNELSKARNVEDQLNQLRKQIIDFENEIAAYKTQIEEKQSELDSLSTFVRELQNKLDDRDKENVQLNNNIIDLSRTLSELESENSNLQIKISQLEEIRNNLNQTVEKHQEELETANNTEWENLRLIESKDNEILKLIKERDNTESIISDLQKVMKEKDEKFHKVTSELKQKYLDLQKKLEENSGSLQEIRKPFEEKVEELNLKNKEQLEKMKKIAANLKKKTQAYQNLEGKYKESQEKWELELREKDLKINEAENKITSLLQQLQELELEVSRLQRIEEETVNLQQLLNDKSNQHQQLVHDFENFKHEKFNELKSFEERNVELQNVITELRVKAEKANEVNLQQELLQTQANFENTEIQSMESSQQAKIQELEMIIESQEAEMSKYKDRVNKLEEGISYIEERRLSLERKAIELGAELQEKSQTCEEISLVEGKLEERLQALTAHDEAIQRKLEEAVLENQELTQQSKKLAEKNDKFKKKLEQTIHKIRELEAQHRYSEELENQNETLKQRVHQLENDLKTVQGSFEKFIEENKNDLDKINADWQSQFDEVVKEKNELMVRCEMFAEEIKDIAEKEDLFNSELGEYKLKIERSNSEIRSYEEQIQILQQENEERKVEREEIESLHRAIEEKEIQIQNYQKQQREQPGKSNPLVSFFDTVQPVSELNPEITKLQEEKRQLETELTAVKNQVEELKTRIAELEEVKKTAEVTVQSIISEAEEKVSPKKELIPQPVPTFVWSEPVNDPFDFVHNQPVVEEVITVKHESIASAEPTKIDNTQELLNKVKTLEFMLYNTEKEKDEALDQCNQLTNELARLVYEKENLPKIVESQILAESQIRDTPDSNKELQNLEFTPVKPPVISSAIPVQEDIIRPKEAYLCFDPEAASSQQPPCNVESQILSNVDIADTPQTRRELQQIEFEQTQAPVSSTTHPIQEQPAQAKEAYLCYETAGASNYDTFGENDDGWGWGPEEAKLEEEHIQRTENAPSKQIEILKDNIRVLELERENHLEEIKQLQIKSGKMIKKLKELKQKNDELQTRKKSESDFFSLDDTIQEEFKLQIQQVEKKLKEAQSELEKEKSEKSNILKRVDVLTAANERMVEMKERQDIELLGWQRSCHEMSAKLQQYEWGDDGFAAEHKIKTAPQVSSDVEELNRKVQDLDSTIQELTLDNEELQALLEEQRTLRVEAEKSKATEPITENMKTEAEFLQVVRERDDLDEKLVLTIEEKKALQNEVNELIKQFSESQKKFEEITNHKEQLDNLIADRDKIIESLNETVANVQSEKAQVIANLENVKQEENIAVTEYQQRIEDLLREKEIIYSDLEEKNAQYEVLKQEQEYLKNQKTEESVAIAEYQQRINDLLREKEIIYSDLEEKNAKYESLKQLLESQKFLKAEENVAIVEFQQRIDDLLREKEIIHNDLEQKNAQCELLRQSLETQELLQKQKAEENIMIAEYQQRIEELIREKEIIHGDLEERNAQFDALKQSVESQESLKEVKLEEHVIVAEYQQRIEDLLREKEILYSDLEEKVAQSELLKQSLDSQIVNLRSELDNQIKTAQSLLDENEKFSETVKSKENEIRKLADEITNKNQEFAQTVEELHLQWAARVDERGNEVAESWRLHVERRESEFADIENVLRKEINEFEEKCNALVNENNELRKNVDAEIRNEVDRVSALQQQITDRQQYINELTRALQEKQSEVEGIPILKEELRDKTVHLESMQVDLDTEKAIVDAVVKTLEEVANQAIQRDKNSILEALAGHVHKLQEADQEIAIIRQQFDELKLTVDKKQEETTKLLGELSECQNELVLLKETHTSLLHSVEEKNQTIDELNRQLQHVQNLKDYDGDNVRNLQQNLHQIQQHNSMLNEQLQDKNVLIQDYQNQIQGYQRLVQQRDFDSDNVRQLLEEKDREHAYAIENLSKENQTYLNEQLKEVETLKKRLLENENRYEELLTVKESDIQTLQAQVGEQSDEISHLTNKSKDLDEISSQLAAKIEECNDLQAKLNEQSALILEDDKQLIELKEIIEEQVLKIEELKKGLFEKSNDYDSLIAEMDISRISPSKDIKEVSRSQNVGEEDLSEPVSRAELDLALYMLHQRDVRCEELTVELTQLLEERDTLQLRLSNAIREKEDLVRKLGGDVKESVPDVTTGAIPKVRSETAIEATEKFPLPDSLATKLSELKTVGYKKDKTIVDEQEFRRFQELSILQQHKDVASKLPPEAAARLVDANYTLSRDVQSPSKVLLNWLWGRSTPKVNNI